MFEGNDYLLISRQAVIESASITGQIGPKSSSDINESSLWISVEAAFKRIK